MLLDAEVVCACMTLVADESVFYFREYFILKETFWNDEAEGAKGL